MNRGFLKGFLAGLLCFVMLFAIVSCAGSDENRLSKKEPTPGAELPDNTGTPTPTLTPAESIKDVNYVDKVKEIAEVLDYYYYQPIDYNEVVDGIYHGMVSALGDPYSAYFNSDELEKFQESSSGSYAGLGAKVSIGEDKYPRLNRVFPGSPADIAGLLADDEIIEVEGQDVYGMELNAVVNMIRGPIGSHLKLTVYRPGENDYLEVDVVRNTVEIPTVEHQMLADGIGYIMVAEFDEVTAAQFDEAINDLQAKHMNALIVDLRGNPGGMLSTVKSMLSRFFKKGTLLVYMDDKYGHREEHYSYTDATIDIPVAVLINGNSASASEVFAGCLQDYDKGILVGTQSFGKGIVQTLIPLSDGSAIKVTISAYYTPKGRNIHKTGLTPDVVVDLKDELKKKNLVTVEEDNQIQEAVAQLRKKMGL